MRLLPKDEILKKKNQNLSLEAQEGLKLTRRVDSLRELVSKSEQDAEKYLYSSLGAIQPQIDEAIKKRDSLNKEISVLQKKLDGMLPEIQTTRQGLAKKEKELESREQILNERDEQVNLKELDIAESTQSLMESINRAKNAEYQRERALEQASRQQREATNSLLSARNIEGALLKEKERMESVFSSRESDLSRKETIFQSTMDEFNKEKRSFDAEKVKFADRKAMLERNLTRLNKLRHDS
jgi:DNA repair exonuclease SbcCD ATPase subunit